ncbi:MAG: hypothetical protein AAF242_06345 [Bacteroidota bacterium]
MKGLAFAYDPSGYWIELVKRNAEAGHPEKFNLGQTMLRVKNVQKSLEFYAGEGGLGMTKASKPHKLHHPHPGVDLTFCTRMSTLFHFSALVVVGQSSFYQQRTFAKQK